MQLRSSLFRRGAVALSGVVVSTLCAGLLLAPLAAAKSQAYVGEIKPTAEPSWVEFKVKSRKNKQTKKFRPVAIKKFTVNFLPRNCTDGELTQSSGIEYDGEIPVSGRKFSVTDTSGDSTLTINGRVSKNGPPTGTVRFVGPVDKGFGVPITCDSGTLSWSAKKVPYL